MEFIKLVFGWAIILGLAVLAWWTLGAAAPDAQRALMDNAKSGVRTVSVAYHDQMGWSPEDCSRDTVGCLENERHQTEQAASRVAQRTTELQHMLPILDADIVACAEAEKAARAAHDRLRSALDANNFGATDQIVVGGLSMTGIEGANREIARQKKAADEAAADGIRLGELRHEAAATVNDLTETAADLEARQQTATARVRIAQRTETVAVAKSDIEVAHTLAARSVSDLAETRTAGAALLTRTEKLLQDTRDQHAIVSANAW